MVLKGTGNCRKLDSSDGLLIVSITMNAAWWSETDNPASSLSVLWSKLVTGWVTSSFIAKSGRFGLWAHETYSWLKEHVVLNCWVYLLCMSLMSTPVVNVVHLLSRSLMVVSLTKTYECHVSWTVFTAARFNAVLRSCRHWYLKRK
jgi:hypothetical protein